MPATKLGLHRQDFSALEISEAMQKATDWIKTLRSPIESVSAVVVHPDSDSFWNVTVFYISEF